MSFIEVNGANLYYQLYRKSGKLPQAGEVPILLIHGSTITGQEDWRLVAPLLAERGWTVIVPDCRGHGQSSNPNHSYSFKEMADDMAGLVTALGYKKAHVIGHSNGGNVALVVLMEHPEVTQTAIPQAANAYVSQDLVEKEPGLFDPERVKRDRPEWMQSMIDLHGATHGPDYWRELLQLTVKEIISEPNYTPEQLGKVNIPTLVIQGEKDGVNAPARHAQFIAGHIPYAELWIPEGVGHNVHLEKLFDWVERVSSFLERRGDPANEALHRLGRDRYPDEREAIFEVRARVQGPDEATRGSISLAGRVLIAKQRQAALECVAAALVNQAPFLEPNADQVQVLLDEKTPWALINRPVTDLRRQPRSLGERLSQGLVGEAVRILEEGDTWSWVGMTSDGYMGWMHSAALRKCPGQEVEEYQAACQSRVIAELLPAWGSPEAQDTADGIIGKLPFGARLPVETRREDLAQVRLPDGRLWWVKASGLLPLEQCPRPDAAGIELTLRLIQRFTGIPYLWGGRSPYGYDCSGLAQTFWGFMGVQIPRDADQQCRAGTPVEGAPQPGDLLFFGEVDEDHPSSRYRSISHVTISLGGDEMIHANGSAWGISYNSLNPGSPRYRAWLHQHLVGVCRPHGG